jgi:hypothetical protein
MLSGQYAQTVSVNKHGTPANLVSSHPRNQNAVKHGAFSKPLRETRVSEIIEELKGTYKVAEEPALAAFKDYAGLLFMIEQIDQELGTRGVLPRNDRGRSLLDLRVRLSRQFQRSRETMLEAVRETTIRSQLRARDEGRQPATREPEPAPRDHQDAGDTTVRDNDALLRQMMVRRAQDQLIAAARDLEASERRQERDRKNNGEAPTSDDGVPGSRTDTTSPQAGACRRSE